MYALVTGLSVVALGLGMGLVFVTFHERIVNPKPYYTERLGSLQILESRMNWVPKGSELSIYITGIITNHSQEAWYSLEFECRFFDRNGVMVDAASPGSRMTVLAMDDAAFRVAVLPGRPTNDYASFKITIANARNAKAWF